MNIQAQTGFTLIEVLIAVAILAFGMLGIAAMQITGVRANQGSYFRSQATYIASDFAERMYANRAGTQALLYDGYNSSTVACGTAVTRCSVDINNAAVPAACTAAQIATYDRFVASCGFSYPGPTPPAVGTRLGGVRDLLPNGQIVVTCMPTLPPTCLPDSQRRIVLTWDERVTTTTSTATATEQSGGQSATQSQQVRLYIVP